jgi:hypothetical protein
MINMINEHETYNAPERMVNITMDIIGWLGCVEFYANYHLCHSADNGIYHKRYNV